MFIYIDVSTGIPIPELIDSISLFQADLAWFAPFSYVVTGMERGIWAALGLIGIKLAGKLRSSAGSTKALALNVVLQLLC